MIRLHEKSLTAIRSIGNLCNDKIQELMENTLSEFHFERMENAEKELLGR